MVCCYADCHNSESRVLIIVKLSGIMLSGIMLSVVMLSVVMLSVIMLSAVMLNVVAPPKHVRPRGFCE
jgi:hypothetical protein